MTKSPRARRTLTTHELARFLALLAETGNFALACLALGRAKSGLYKRRARDSLFDSECTAALAMFRLSHRAQGRDCVAIASLRVEMAKAGRRGVRPQPSEPVRRHVGFTPRDGSSSPQLKTTPGTLIRTTYRGRAQLRRAPPGRLTRIGLETFLRTLAATGNVRFAAHSVGVSASSIHYRRRTDPAFAAEAEAAIDCAVAALEMRVIEASGTLGDWLDDESPSPLAGEGGLAEGERGEADFKAPTARERRRNVGGGEGAAGGAGTVSDAEPDYGRHAISGLTVSEALHFLDLHSRSRGPEHKGAIAQQSGAYVEERPRAGRRGARRNRANPSDVTGFTPVTDSLPPSPSPPPPPLPPAPEPQQPPRPLPRIRRL